MTVSTLHLCNTFFEWELANRIGPDVKAALHKSPIFLQLQFLPYLYAKPSEGIVVSEKPTHASLPTFTLEERPSYQRLETWGYSLLAKHWADSRNIAYPIPPWDVVKKVNSKEYSFSKSPLPGSRLLYPKDPLEKSAVLKSCFGTAGRGLMFTEDPKAKDFCEKEWKLGFPVLLEPWVERKLDFSTQWKISPTKEIQYFGVTLCKTSKKGVHQSNRTIRKIPSYVEEQKTFVLPVLQEMAEIGFFGEVGFDAMIYENHQLQPIVEINARKTMGWLALTLQKNHFPNEELEIAYIHSSETHPLPRQLGQIKFSRQIVMTKS